MLTIRAMSDGKGYSARYLERSDYYAVAAARDLASYASRYRSPVVQGRVWQLNVKHQPRMEHRYEHSIDR